MRRHFRKRRKTYHPELEGILKKNSQNKTQHAIRLARPWNDLWQLWEKFPGENEPWILTSEATSIEHFKNDLHFVALPAREVTALAAWFPTSDPALLQESVLLQLEVAGFTSSSTLPSNVDVRKLQQNGETSLARACVFPSDFPVSPTPRYQGFFPSPFAIALQEDTILCWREGDWVVVVVPCRTETAVWEACSNADDPACFKGWLESFFLELQPTKLLEPIRKIKDFSGLLPPSGFLGISVEPISDPQGPTPKIPSPLPSWFPPGVRDAIASSERMKKIRIAAIAASVVLAAIALSTGSFLINLHWKTLTLQKQLQKIEDQASPSMRTARQWEILAPSIDTSLFPLERLLLAVQSLPREGVRLSVFETIPDGIRIEGDARNVGLATLYFNTLQTAPGSEAFDWKMPSPALQPDNSARFAIDGRFRQ